MSFSLVVTSYTKSGERIELICRDEGAPGYKGFERSEPASIDR